MLAGKMFWFLFTGRDCKTQGHTAHRTDWDNGCITCLHGKFN